MADSLDITPVRGVSNFKFKFDLTGPIQDVLLKNQYRERSTHAQVYSD